MFLRKFILPILLVLFAGLFSLYAFVALQNKGMLGVTYVLLGVIYGLILVSLGIKQDDTSPLRPWHIFVAMAVCLLPLVAIRTLFSSDVHDYMAYGRMMWSHHLNPYITVMQALLDDPVIGQSCLASRMNPMQYGPVWAYCTAGIAALADVMHMSYTQQVMVYKVLFAFLHLLNGFLVWSILSDKTARMRMLGTAFYCFNPLLLIEFAHNAHNDCLMITFILLGVLYLRKSQGLAGMLFLLCALMVKIYSAPLLAIAFVYVLRGRDRLRDALVDGTVIILSCVVVFLLVYMPFRGNPEVLVSVFMSDAVITKSTVELMLVHFRPQVEGVLAGLGIAGPPEQVLSYAALMTMMAIIALIMLTVRTWNGMLRGMFWYAFTWCAAGATWFMPWYATFTVAIAAISGSLLVRNTAFFLSLAVFVIDACEQSGSSSGLIGFLYRWNAAFMFGLPLLLGGILSLPGLRKRHTVAVGGVKEGDGAGRFVMKDSLLDSFRTRSGLITLALATVLAVGGIAGVACYGTRHGPYGLTGEYYAGRNFEELVKTRQDRRINFRWRLVGPIAPHSNGDYSIRWTGLLDVTEEGSYKFWTYSDDGARLWIDGEPVIEHWTEHMAELDMGKAVLSKGPHSIRLEFFNAVDQGTISLFWKHSNWPYKVVIPAERLRPQAMSE